MTNLAERRMPKTTTDISEGGIDYDNLESHPLANKLPMIKPEKFEELKADISRHGLEQKLILFCGNPDGTSGPLRLLDGRNRFKALKALGIEITEAVVEVFDGTYAEAKAKVYSLNYNRRQLSAKEQRDVIKNEIVEMIGEPPAGGYTEKKLGEVGHRTIARIVGCSHNTVASVIEELQDPPELKKYRQWLKTWKKELSDDQRLMFVRENGVDLSDMLREIGGLVNLTS